jgi:hypothetical protein
VTCKDSDVTSPKLPLLRLPDTGAAVGQAFDCSSTNGCRLPRESAMYPPTTQRPNAGHASASICAFPPEPGSSIEPSQVLLTSLAMKASSPVASR